MFLKIINFLTISRIIIGVIIFILLAFDRNALLSFVLFLFAGLTDYFDGFLARKYKLTSQFGEITDPIADKILIVFVLFGLSIHLSSYLIGFAGSIIVSREIWVSALRDYGPLRRRIMPSCATLATSSPCRLKMRPRLKPRPPPLHGASVA